jgi:uncharacterized protein YllA (UPF0747 family)
VALTAILRTAAASQDVSKKSLDHITTLTRADSVAIVTGQQPAVGGGPLYSLVKTAHVIALARALGTNAVPVFWCASEDHDLGEAGHADVIARDGSIHRFTGDLGGGRASLRFRPANAWWDALIVHCQQHLGTGVGHTWLEQHRPQSDEGMGAWTCRLLCALFSAHGLVSIEGHLLRPLWTTTLRRAIDAWPAGSLADLRQQLLTAGAADPFGPLESPPLFADRADGRIAVDAAQTRTLLANEPTALSPGASLRPILQQAALPALAYVGGPGELAYHRFIMPLYAALGVAAPILIPRCSLTLVPSWVRRGCERWQVAPEAIAGQTPALPSGTNTVLEQLDSALRALEQQALPDTHHRRLQAGMVRLRRERDRLAESLTRGDRQAAERPAWGALQGWLHPRGGRQERTLSLFQAVWQFGPGIADRLVDAAAVTAAGVHGWVDLR